jgi:cell division protein FtsB
MVRVRIGARRATATPKHARRNAAGGADAAVPARQRRLWGRPPLLFVLVPITVVLLAITALPTRQWFDNRQAIAAAESQLAEIRAANDEASASADSLQSGAELERLAREQYGYAKPGEEVYHVLPAPQDPVRVPDTWPFNSLGAALGR